MKKVMLQIPVTLADGDEEADVCNLINKVLDVGKADAADTAEDHELENTEAAEIVNRMEIGQPEVVDSCEAKLDYNRTVTVAQLVNFAGQFNEEPDLNCEYLRGQVELICDAAGVAMDDRDIVIEAVQAASTAFYSQPKLQTGNDNEDKPIANPWAVPAQELLDRGYAVVIWTPDELRGAHPRKVEERSIELTWDVIHALGGPSPDQEDALDEAQENTDD